MCAGAGRSGSALTRGIGRAADMRIRIKDSLALERLDKADVVVFDKTGTLTEGQPTVTAWLWAQYQEEDFSGYCWPRK